MIGWISGWGNSTQHSALSKTTTPCAKGATRTGHPLGRVRVWGSTFGRTWVRRPKALSPLWGLITFFSHPRLAPWALFLRRYAAGGTLRIFFAQLFLLQ